jgi:hypothetical protein
MISFYAFSSFNPHPSSLICLLSAAALISSVMAPTFGGNMSGDSLTITDNRTGKQYELPVENGTIRAMDLRQIKVSDDDFGLMTYDPAFMNTASCKSRYFYRR